MLRVQFNELNDKDIDKLPAQLSNPLKYRFQSILLVAEDGDAMVRGFAREPGNSASSVSSLNACPMIRPCRPTRPDASRTLRGCVFTSVLGRGPLSIRLMKPRLMKMTATRPTWFSTTSGKTTNRSAVPGPKRSSGQYWNASTPRSAHRITLKKLSGRSRITRSACANHATSKACPQLMNYCPGNARSL